MTPMRSIIVWILISFFSLCLCKFLPAEDNEKENDIVEKINDIIEEEEDADYDFDKWEGTDPD